MKKTLTMLALSAALAVSSAYGLTSETAYTPKDLALATNAQVEMQEYGIVYADGVLSAPGLSSDITFDFNYGAISTTTNSPLIYVTKDGADTTWGFMTTTDGGLTGLWNMANWTTGGSVTKDTLITYDQSDKEESGTIKVTAKITDAGTYLYKGDSTDAQDQLYGSNSLKASPATTTNTTINTNLISTLYFTINIEGNTTYSHNGYTTTKEVDTHIDATKTRVQLDGGANGSAAAVNEAGNPIYVGGTGQLFLQAWNTGAIELDNDIYLADGTYDDKGDLRLGNDGAAANTINLNGKITVLENAVMHANGGQAVNITGTVTDKFNVDGSASEGGQTLTIKGAGYNFTGTVDVTRVELANNASVALTMLNASELVLGTGVTLSLSADASVTLGSLDITNALTLGGSILDGLNAIGDSVNLFTVETLTGWTPGAEGYMIATEWLTFNAEKFNSGILSTNTVLTYTGNTLALTVIPEPATATLSLLALAGLAARRRRK